MNKIMADISKLPAGLGYANFPLVTIGLSTKALFKDDFARNPNVDATTNLRNWRDFHRDNVRIPLEANHILPFTYKLLSLNEHIAKNPANPWQPPAVKAHIISRSDPAIKKRFLNSLEENGLDRFYAKGDHGFGVQRYLKGGDPTEHLRELGVQLYLSTDRFYVRKALQMRIGAAHVVTRPQVDFASVAKNEHLIIVPKAALRRYPRRKFERIDINQYMKENHIQAVSVKEQKTESVDLGDLLKKKKLRLLRFNDDEVDFAKWLDQNKGHVNLQALFEGLNVSFEQFFNVQEMLQRKQLRVFDDGDAILFSDEAEIIFQEQGLEEFNNHERSKSKLPLPRGPLTIPHLDHQGNPLGLSFLEGMMALRGMYPPEWTNADPRFSDEVSPLMQGLLTARGAATTLRAHNTISDELKALFDVELWQSGREKGPVARILDADLIIDDGEKHIASAATFGIPGAHVIWGVKNEKGDKQGSL